MNERITPVPSYSPDQDVIRVTPAPSVSPLASPAPEAVEETLEPLLDDRSLNPPAVSDALLRRFAAILDREIPINENRDYIIFAEDANYSDVSLYIFDYGSTLNSDGTVIGTYTRYRVYNSYLSDARFSVTSGLSSKLVFPALNEVRSANVYSNVFGYSPNPFYAEIHHAHSSAVADFMGFLVLSFSAIFALILGVLGKCLRK